MTPGGKVNFGPKDGALFVSIMVPISVTFQYTKHKAAQIKSNMRAWSCSLSAETEETAGSVLPEIPVGLMG